MNFLGFIVAQAQAVGLDLRLLTSQKVYLRKVFDLFALNIDGGVASQRKPNGIPSIANVQQGFANIGIFEEKSRFTGQDIILLPIGDPGNEESLRFQLGYSLVFKLSRDIELLQSNRILLAIGGDAVGNIYFERNGSFPFDYRGG